MKFFKMTGLLIGMLMGAWGANPLWADEIPADMLKMDLEKCTATCPEVNGKKVCEFLCSCTIDHFKKALDYDQYVVLTAQMSKQKISENNQLFLLDVGRRCEGQLDEKFPELKQQMLEKLKKQKELEKAKPKTKN